jgi:hypothetical protein
MRFPIYNVILILFLGAAIGSIITYLIMTHEKPVSPPDKGALLAKCELQARERYNLNIDGEFRDATDFYKLCMRTSYFQFNDENYECDVIKRESPDLIKLKEQYDATKTQAEKDEINRQTGRMVIILQSMQATSPVCYEYLGGAKG